jgi:hypothetical protein
MSDPHHDVRSSNILAQEAEVISAPQPSGTTTSSNLKRKCGHRRRNQIPERGQLVTE